MYYTYILESLKNPDEKYIGQASDHKNRIIEHILYILLK